MDHHIYSKLLESICEKLKKKLSKSIKSLEIFADAYNDETLKFYTSSLRYYLSCNISYMIIYHPMAPTWIDNKRLFGELLEKFRIYCIDYPVCEKHVYDIIDNVRLYKSQADQIFETGHV